MKWPQISLLVLIALNVVVAFCMDGEKRDNFSFRAALFDAILSIWLLKEGGFFGGAL